MKMKDPDATYSAPAELDLEQRYRARLDEIEERESTTPGAKPGATYLAYKFSLHDLDNIPVLDDNGDLYQQWLTANTNTGYSRAPYIGSREIAEALLGRKLDSEEIRAHMEDWDDWLIGKTAMVDMMKTTDEKSGNERIRIVRILPDKKTAAKTPAPARVEPAAAETKEQRRARLQAELAATEAA